MTKTISCDKCNGRGYFTFEQFGADYAGATVLRCEVCQGSGMLEVPMTNADHIRSMTDEELAKWLDEDLSCCCYCSEDERLENEPLLHGEKCDEQCKKHLLDWLKQPYKEDT